MVQHPLITLIKPRILFSNLITLAGGFFLASKGHIDWKLFLAVVVGMGLVIASACVLNNYIDRDIDPLLGKRTQQRALVQKRISPFTALIYGCILGLSGFVLLFLTVPLWAVAFALLGFLVYVLIYSLWMKRRSAHAILVGSLAGACPPVVGYCAVTGQVDLGAVTLFLILSLWQMPHSYALAILGMEAYERASIPVLPLKEGLRATKIQILIYIIGFMAATFLLTFLGYTGYIFLIIAAAIGAFWLRLAILGFHTTDDKRWARQMLSISIIAILILSITMSLDFHQ